MLRQLAVRTVFLACLAQCFCTGIYPASVIAEEVSQPAGSQAADALLRNANALAAANKLPEADVGYKAALAAAEKAQGPDGLLVAVVLHWQAIFLRDKLHQYDDAWNAAQRAAVIRRNKLGQDHPLTARIEGLLGSISLFQNDLSKGQPHFRAVIDAYNRHPSKEFDQTAAFAAKQVADFLRQQSRFSEAESMMRRGIEIRERRRPLC